MLKSLVNLVAAAALLGAAPAFAQIQEIDPNRAAEAEQYGYPVDEDPAPVQTYEDDSYAPVDPRAAEAPRAPEASQAPAAEPFDARSIPLSGRGDTVPRDDLINAAEGVFGRGAQGLARLIENILRDQGEPVAYIAGQEAAGAFIYGVRYGSRTMHHRIEGERPVYWTGPSIGFDAGGDANKVFVLVYNLHDSQELFRRFPSGEGRAYFVGGLSAQYMRRGDVVLIPIRLGVGLRLGVNAGYMRFSERNRWLPF
ncbi:MAG: DUF1134 domain-containing protein [Sphingosinicella sp.]|uniref:DUF1134 domain-containing protein n=1 Tax=Sphingosinicella sp. TaxID=1917971 RepID=UPI0040378EF1